MAAKQTKRSRGVRLTATGHNRLCTAKQAFENQEKNGERFTLEELNERTGLAFGTLTRVLNREGVVDKRTLTIAFRAFDLDLTPEDYVKPTVATGTAPSPHPLGESTAGATALVRANTRYDWGSAVDISQFQHRKTELSRLERWIHQDGCRLVALLGMGGIGKTYLAVKVGQQLQPQFDRVLWRSLRSSPAVDSLLEDMVAFLTGQPAPRATLNQLTKALKTERCLIILDNLESVMQSAGRAGTWSPGYQDYGELMRLWGTAEHQSCLLFTSRENPAEVAAIAGGATVQTLTLRGCSDVSLGILQARGLKGELHQLHQLCRHYGGLPLALNMVANLIQDLFGGNVDQFLDQGAGLVGDLNDLLASQVDRLNEVDRAIAYWLAIYQDAMTLADLEQAIIPAMPRQTLLDSVESLRRRSLVESQQGAYTLQSVMMTYISDRLVAEAATALQAASPSRDLPRCCLHTHALLQAQAPAQVKAAQRTHLLQPILDRLLQQSRPPHLATRLKALLPLKSGQNSYWAANLLHLLIQLEGDLSGQSLAGLTLWQVDFHGVNLAHTDFRQADLSRCRFSHTFGPVYALAFSPDDRTLVTGHGDGDLRQWQLDGRLLQQYQYAAPISTLATSPDGMTLAVGAFDGSVHLYQQSSTSPTLTPLRSLSPHDDWVYAIAFVPHSDQGASPAGAGRQPPCIASGSSDGLLQIWDADTAEVQNSFEMGPITGLSISQDGWLVCSDEEGLLQLWQVDSPDEPWQFEHALNWVSVAISHDGTLVASVDSQHLQIWQRQGQTLIPLWQMAITSAWAVTFSPVGHTLAVTDGAEIHVVDAATSAPLHTLAGHPSQVWSIAFDPTGTLLASGSDDQINLWEVESGKVWRTWKTAAVSDSPILAATFSRDSQYLVSGNGRGEVRLWNRHTQRCLATMANHTQPVRSLALCPESKFVASGDNGGTVRLWNLKTQTDITAIQHPANITALVMSPDGAWIASGSADGTLRLADIYQTHLQTALMGHGGRVLAIAFSPDSQWLATGSSDYTIRLWQVGHSAPEIMLKGHQGWIWAVAFSPDGKWLATGSDDYTVKLWDIEQKTCIRTFAGHDKLVWSVTFWSGIDGAPPRLVSGSLDQTIKVWNPETGDLLDTLPAQTDLLWAIRPVGPDLAIAGTQGNTLRLWDLARKTQGVNLTPQPLYAGMDITEVKGLAPATINSLMPLGAIAEPQVPAG